MINIFLQDIQLWFFSVAT